VVKTFVILTVCLAIIGCSRGTNVWDGVYTADQATRGAEVYNSNCAYCHSVSVDDFNRKLIGKAFIDNWREDSVKPLFDRVKSMPPDVPTTLSDRQYLDVLSFILKRNGFPEGQRELSADILEHVQITGRNGPEPLPSGASAQALGCLTRVSETTWKLTKASRLVRMRSFRDLTSDELRTYHQHRLGQENIVLNTTLFHHFAGSADLLPLINHKVIVSGRLVRKGADVHLDIIRAQEIDRNCMF